MTISDALTTMSLIFIGLAVILIPLELIVIALEKKNKIKPFNPWN